MRLDALPVLVRFLFMIVALKKEKNIRTAIVPFDQLKDKGSNSTCSRI